MTIAAAAIFLIAAIAYGLLGNAVSHAPPTGIDAAAKTLTGEAPRVAAIFTESCLWPVLTAFGLIGCFVAVRAPAWRARIVFAIITTAVGWQTSNVLKDLFERPRPTYWIVFHETSYAYSSGHAMFATIVYWLWAYFIARSALPSAVRFSVSLVLVIWGIGVIWSRLALGAHYPTDLAGGILLGIALLALAYVVARIFARADVRELPTNAPSG